MAARTKSKFEQEFWKRTKKQGECLVWTGATTIKHGSWGGYGKGKWAGRFYLAHRMAYELFYGIKPPEDKVVMHSCDNPPCVNPSHLKLLRQRIGQHLSSSDLSRESKNRVALRWWLRVPARLLPF